MDKEKRKELILRKPKEEIITEEDLDEYLEKGIPLKHYIGFEISGKIHLGTGLITMQKVADLQKAGVDVNILLADWHSWINDKLGGNLEKIRKFAVGYFKEGLKASLKCVGGDPEKVDFHLGSELYSDNEYWRTLVDISKNITLNRVQRSLSIAGRKMGKGVDFAKLIYPPMQLADIFIQGINLAHGGTDQRKAHVVAREVAKKLKFSPLVHEGEKYKPLAIHTHLLLGLQKPPVWPIPEDMDPHDLWTKAKMSKSKPNTCVFIHDSPEEIREKIKDAFCPAENTDFNPILDWTEHIIFRSEDSRLKVERPEKYGGNLVLENQEELEEVFGKGDLHPFDLKKAVADKIVEILEPAREHFNQPEKKKMLEEMEEMVKITR